MSAPCGPSSDLTTRVQQYLQERRRLGLKLCSLGHALRNFARFVTGIGHTRPLTVDLMAQWARQVQPRYLVDGQADSDTAARRLAALRPFMRWLQQYEQSTEIPDDCSFGPIPGRVAPHIYREAEIVALMGAARRLGPSDGLRGSAHAAHSKLGSASSPCAIERARGRRTAMRWPPSTTWLSVLPPRTARRRASGTPLGPHSAIRSASIIAASTRWPASMHRPRKAWRTSRSTSCTGSEI